MADVTQENLENESVEEENIEEMENFDKDDIKEEITKRSPYWIHFTEVIDSSGTTFAKCKLCVDIET